MANENAIVNTTPTTSETPSNLVGKKEAPELSPNPAGFGFTKQLVVNSLPSPSGEPNVLYLVPQYDGEGHVKEYYKYKWDFNSGYIRVFEPVNNVSYKKGEHSTPVKENVPPKQAPEKIYNGPVAFNDDIIYKGRVLVRPLCAFEVDNIKEIPQEILDQLRAGDVVVKRTIQSGHVFKHTYVVSFQENEVGICLTYTDAAGVETQSYDYTDGAWVYNSEDKWSA